jgi:phosphoserine aminotransferase
MLNFNPGPGILPLTVLQTIQTEFLDFRGTNCSLLELSHRSNQIQKVINEAKMDLGQLLQVKDTHDVLFMQV